MVTFSSSTDHLQSSTRLGGSGFLRGHTAQPSTQGAQKMVRDAAGGGSSWLGLHHHGLRPLPGTLPTLSLSPELCSRNTALPAQPVHPHESPSSFSTTLTLTMALETSASFSTLPLWTVNTSRPQLSLASICTASNPKKCGFF